MWDVISLQDIELLFDILPLHVVLIAVEMFLQRNFQTCLIWTDWVSSTDMRFLFSSNFLFTFFLCYYYVHVYTLSLGSSQWLVLQSIQCLLTIGIRWFIIHNAVHNTVQDKIIRHFPYLYVRVYKKRKLCNVIKEHYIKRKYMRFSTVDVTIPRINVRNLKFV